MSIITLSDAWASFCEHVAPYGDPSDEVVMSEGWNDYTDALQKDGQLTALQVSHCPAYGEDMPEDDIDHISDALGISLSYDLAGKVYDCTLRRGDKAFRFVYILHGAPSISDVIEMAILEDDDDESNDAAMAEVIGKTVLSDFREMLDV